MPALTAESARHMATVASKRVSATRPLTPAREAAASLREAFALAARDPEAREIVAELLATAPDEEPPMDEREAGEEARRRWGAAGSASCALGVCSVGVWRGRHFEARGVGRTWGEAFTDADAHGGTGADWKLAIRDD